MLVSHMGKDGAAAEPQEVGDSNQEKLQGKTIDRLLQEIRILLQGVQVLGGFLIVLPFNQRFSEISAAEKWVYLATFLSAAVSMLCFSAPATHQRLPLRDIDAETFEQFATTMIILGVIGLSAAVIFSTQFVLAFVFDDLTMWVGTIALTLLILVAWWLVPQFYKSKQRNS